MQVQIETNRFFRSHMKQPKGYGLWLFENEAKELVFTFTGLYSQCKAAAVTWAKANGCQRLYVCP